MRPGLIAFFATCLALALAPRFADAKQKEKVVYQFKGGTDGAAPLANLIDIGGTLYGTTASGGSPNCSGGCGTVFAVTLPSGVEKVVYAFRGGQDGANPAAGLINVNGTLYSTTSAGGGSANCTGGCGTVFSVTPSGLEKVVYAFKGDADGAAPVAGVIDVNGTLYGTTPSGGSATCGGGCGTVFTVTPSGTETILHAFASTEGDGWVPYGGLLNVSGTLYGTTFFGGTSTNSNCGSGTGGCGTVFAVTLSGGESVVYSFQGKNNQINDGAYPFSGLIDVGGILYGTTNSSGSGSGTVFSVTPAGAETVLHVFYGPYDGAGPVSNLINVNGTLYGTTPYGGGLKNKTCHKMDLGCGTVFQVTTTGNYAMLHHFTNPQDGYYPYGSLLYIKKRGAFYGATEEGGGGYGTVFKFTP